MISSGSTGEMVMEAPAAPEVRRAESAVGRSKIAVIASYTPSLTNFRLELLKRLVEAGHRVTAFAPEDDPVVKADLARLGIEFIPVPMARAGLNPLEDLRTLTFLVRVLRQLKPDTVIPYTMKPIIYGGIAARLAGVRNRCFLVTGLGHVFSEAGGASPKGKLVRSISVALYKIAFSGAKVVFAYNDADERDIRHYHMLADNSLLQLVPGSGVDVDHFGFSEVPDGKLTFLLVARLLKDKGILDYVEAARIVRRTYPDAEFQLLGHFDPNPAAISREEIDAWMREGAINYLGETRDVRPYLAKCSVFVLPSYYREGIPRSILEALSTGRPVITTNLDGCKDTVEDGRNGFLVPPRDPQVLAEAMMRFAADPELSRRMGRQSRQIAEQKFDVHHVNRLLMGRMHLS